MGNHQKALEAYVQAASQGILISIVNQANVLEMLGYYHEAESTFKQALQKAETLVFSPIIPTSSYLISLVYISLCFRVGLASMSRSV